jgi:ribosomal protein L34E
MSTAPHSFNRKILTWMRCGRCGLILLGNKETRKEANRMCKGRREDEE